MISEFFTEQVKDVLLTLLVLAGGVLAIIYHIAYKMEQANNFLHADDLDTDPIPDHFQPRAEHIKRVLADLESLRTPLKDYKLPRAGADPYVPHVTDVRLP